MTISSRSFARRRTARRATTATLRADARRGDDGDDDAARRDDGDDASDAARDARRETRAAFRTTRGGCGARWTTKRRDGTRDDDAGRRTNDARTIDVVR